MGPRVVIKGQKAIQFIEREGGAWTACCTCNATHALVEVSLNRKQALELLNPDSLKEGRRIQEILPALPKQIREIFISGTTPAEWDLMLRGKLRSNAFYARLGYVFRQD